MYILDNIINTYSIMLSLMGKLWSEQNCETSYSVLSSWEMTCFGVKSMVFDEPTNRASLTRLFMSTSQLSK